MARMYAEVVARDRPQAVARPDDVTRAMRGADEERDGQPDHASPGGEPGEADNRAVRLGTREPCARPGRLAWRSRSGDEEGGRERHERDVATEQRPGPRPPWKHWIPSICMRF